MAAMNLRTVASRPRRTANAHAATTATANPTAIGHTKVPSELYPSGPCRPKCDATGSGRSSAQESATATAPAMIASGTTSVSSVGRARR